MKITKEIDQSMFGSRCKVWTVFKTENRPELSDIDLPRMRYTINTLYHNNLANQF